MVIVVNQSFGGFLNPSLLSFPSQSLPWAFVLSVNDQHLRNLFVMLRKPVVWERKPFVRIGRVMSRNSCACFHNDIWPILEHWQQYFRKTTKIFPSILDSARAKITMFPSALMNHGSSQCRQVTRCDHGLASWEMQQLEENIQHAGVEYRVTMIINAEHCFKSKSLPFAQRITCPLNRLHLQSGVCAKLCKTVRLKWRREIVS